MQNSKTNSAYSTNQTNLTGVRDYREPQTVPFNELIPAITEANAAGFEPVRLDTDRKRGEYTVTFLQITEAQAHRIAAIVGNARLAALKPVDDTKPADDVNDATGPSVDARWRAVVQRHLQKQSGDPLFETSLARTLGRPDSRRLS